MAKEAVFARNEDYGNDLFWVTVKSTARPLCYPWQGKVISRNDRSGYVEDLDGNRVEIIPISSTSYGEPAGLYGINCGHVPPNVFIPGLGKVRGEVPNEAENNARYAESQEQRGLALVSCVDDDYTIVLDNDEVGMKIRADEEKVRNAVPVSNKALLARYADRIEILDIYYEDTEVVNARAMPELDPFRHPQYPDDLFVFFLAQDKHYEQMWVRCGKYLFDADGIKVFTGTLLNEPNRDMGIHD